MKGAVAWYSSANTWSVPVLSSQLCPLSSSKLCRDWFTKYLRWVVQGLCRTVDFLCPRCLSKTRQSLCWLSFSIETINTPCYTSASIVPHKVVDRTSWQLLESIHLLKDQIWWFLKFALSALPGIKGQLEFTDLWGDALGCLVVWHQFIKSLIRMSRNMLYLTSLLYLT